MTRTKYPEIDSMSTAPLFDPTRREFLKLFGGGILITFFVGDFSSAAGQPRGDSRIPTDPNAFLRIGEDGQVTCLTGKIEMGQGPITSLAQTLADELDVRLDDVEMLMGDTDLCPYDRGTFGSLTTRAFGPLLRAAAAEARGILIALASEHLGVPGANLSVENGVVFDKRDRAKRVTYAQLTKGKRIVRRLEEKPAVKVPSEFKLIGKPLKHRDAPEKVTGAAKFTADLRFPDMLYAVILRPPSHDAVLKSVDTSAVEDLEGIRVVREDDFIAVLHSDPEKARKAMGRVIAEYEQPESDIDDKTIFKHLLSVAPEGDIVDSGGVLDQGRQLSENTVEEKYLNSYVAHSPMEPHAAVAKIDGDKITVWASTQTPFPLKEEIAGRLDFPADKVRVIVPFVGGGFGGKSPSHQAVEAARLAKLTGKPVQVAWSRAEEFFYDSFRPAAVVSIASGVTGEGKIVYWDYHVYFAGQRGSQQFYDIPHHRTMAHSSGWGGAPGSHPFNTGAWRAPGNNTNTFARESQIDILAHKAGMDPLDFRLKNLKDERMIRVLEAAANKFGYTPAKGPSGRGYGIACGIDAGTYVGHIAEVSVDKNSGHVQVRRVVCAQDMGLVVNPQGAKLQIEGCITMGLGYALTEEIHFKGGKIRDLNYDTYEFTRFSWTPEIETVLVENREPDPHGGGEPAIICMGAVVANAIFDACGARLFQLPMTPERVRQAV